LEKSVEVVYRTVYCGPPPVHAKSTAHAERADAVKVVGGAIGTTGSAAADRASAAKSTQEIKKIGRFFRPIFVFIIADRRKRRSASYKPIFRRRNASEN
jgi:hypothetical protein